MCSHDNWKLVRTDKNGTEYYEDDTCQRCGGHGGWKGWPGFTCYECGGTGKSKTRIWKKYTPEYAEKLEQQRKERAKKKAPALNESLFGKLGLAADGSAWVVMGNTYERKNELKEAGARFHPSIGWYFSEQMENFECCHFVISDFGEQNEFGRWNIPENYWEGRCHLADKIAKAQEEYVSGKSCSDFVGEIGDKISIEVTVDRVTGYETQWGFTSVYIMVDADGNIFVWKTSTDALDDADKGSHVKLNGKIKDHSEYKGIKQNILTRCKVEIC